MDNYMEILFFNLLNLYLYMDNLLGTIKLHHEIEGRKWKVYGIKF